MFAEKAEAYPSEAPLQVLHSWVGSWFVFDSIWHKQVLTGSLIFAGNSKGYWTGAP